MALTHVCVWDGKIGYRSVTIEEAAQMYPYGVAANRGIFVCSLCAQNVSLTAPGANVRHFRHTSAAQKKECEDRAQAYARAGIGYNCHPMPLRIKVSRGNFLLELGFFQASSAIDRPRCHKIIITGDNGQKYVYSFERLSSEGITYLSAGNIPSTYYQLSYDRPTLNLNRYWPSKTAGIDRKGSFFDCSSGKMLYSGSKAYPHQDYYLLCCRSIGYIPSGISYQCVAETRTSFNTTWYLYRIHVHDFSAPVARFFLERSIFLTEKPTSFYPVWPPYIEDPYFIYHSDPRMYFYMQGDDTELNIYPNTMYSQYEDLGDSKLYMVYAASKEQLLSLGQSGAIGFSYLMTKRLNMITDSPLATIKKIDGEAITEDICTQLPKGRQITIQVPNDGKALVLKNGRIVEIRHISHEQIITIDGLSFGYEIRVFQGCDLVRVIKFEKLKENKDYTITDQELVEKLNSCRGPSIAVPHSVAALACELSNFPQSKKWLYQVIRRGEISVEAFKLLIAFKIGKRGDHKI